MILTQRICDAALTKHYDIKETLILMFLPELSQIK